MMTADHDRPGTGRLCLRLALATTGLWTILLLPAWLLAEWNGILGLTISAGLCVIPGWVVFFAGPRYVAPDSQALFLALGGTGLRMVFVLVGMLGVRAVLPQLGFREFTLWLLVFYLATLVIETWMVLRQSAGAGLVQVKEQSRQGE